MCRAEPPSLGAAVQVGQVHMVGCTFYLKDIFTKGSLSVIGLFYVRLVFFCVSPGSILFLRGGCIVPKVPKRWDENVHYGH